MLVQDEKVVQRVNNLYPRSSLVSGSQPFRCRDPKFGFAKLWRPQQKIDFCCLMAFLHITTVYLTSKFIFSVTILKNNLQTS